MTKASPPRGPLLVAAEKLDASLAQHAKATRELLRLSLDNRRDLSRAQEVIGRLSDHDTELAADMQGFMAAVTETGATQQADADKVNERAQEVVQRTAQLQALDSRLSLLLEAVKKIRELLESLKESGIAAGGATALAQLNELVGIAQGVNDDARAQNFEEVARDAHSLRQQLESVVRRAEELERRLPRA